jgi:hypothetical protein
MNADAAERYRSELRDAALRSTYVFARDVCNYRRLRPDLHGFMADWIATSRNAPIRKLGIAPRGHYKTSVMTIGDKLRRVTANPDLRVLLLNETQDNTEKWIAKMQAIVLSPKYRWLFPECVPDLTNRKVRWNSVQLELERPVKHEQATIEGFGVGGASTSNHYNVICEDDLVGRKALDSAPEMRKAIDQHKLSESLLIDPEEDEVDYVGTRWGAADVAAYILDNEPDVDYLCLSLYGEDGAPIFPERFSPGYIEYLKRKYGPRLFALQYLNKALPEGSTSFDPAHLRRYRLFERSGADGAIERSIELRRPPGEGVSRVFALRDCVLFQTIDAGLSPESPDARTASVVAAITPPVVDVAGIEIEPFQIVLLDARAKACDPPSAVRLAHEAYLEFDPSLSAIEIFGGHKTYYYWMLQNYPNWRLWPLPTDTRRSKETRIREFYAYIVQHRFWLLQGGAFDFELEYESFPSGQTCDLLDAAAYLPAIWWAPPAVTEQGVLASRVVPPGIDADAYAEAELREADVDATRSEVTGY